MKFEIKNANFTIVTRKGIVWIHGAIFEIMLTIAGWSFTEGTDIFRKARGIFK